MLSLLFSLLWARPEPDVVKSKIDTYNQIAYMKVSALNEKQLQNLTQGKVVKLIQKGKSKDGDIEAGKVRAYYISDLPKAQLWLAFQDGHFQVQESTKEFMFEQHGVDKIDWYGFIDLPWPLSDRHWLVRVWNSHDVAAKTNNEMWEHPWELIQNGDKLAESRVKGGAIPGLTPQMFDKALYLPDSTGSWVAIDIDKHTLLIYSATATVGGSIPEGLMMRYLMSGLDTFILDGEKRARKGVPKHYRGSHEPMYGGDGKPIALFP